MKRTLAPVALVIAATMLSACGTTTNSNRAFGTTMTDEAFGNAVREARMRQTIDLNAGHKDTYTGTDGNTAAASMKRYHKSLKQPKPTIKVLGIGTSDN